VPPVTPGAIRAMGTTQSKFLHPYSVQRRAYLFPPAEADSYASARHRGHDIRSAPKNLRGADTDDGERDLIEENRLTCARRTSKRASLSA
jgi:hypothetical protein